ncbi:MAG: hypothetical protein HQL39_16315 [Alphaproteobacteria bacterium]|nr:hypothetical protein [Alphaproteobacteria bacterium]
MLSDAVIGRLKDTCRPPLRLVDGLLELAGAPSPPQVPAAYVLPSSESAEPNLKIGADRPLQRIVEMIEVVLVARAGTSLDSLRDVVRDALRGWAPEGVEPLEYRGAAIIDIKAGEVWRALRFEAVTFV